MCLAQGHNAVTPLRLEPAAPQSRVKHSTTKPVCSLLNGLRLLQSKMGEVNLQDSVAEQFELSLTFSGTESADRHARRLSTYPLRKTRPAKTTEKLLTVT